MKLSITFACIVFCGFFSLRQPALAEAPVDPNDPYYQIKGEEFVHLKNFKDPKWFSEEDGARSTFRIYRGDRQTFLSVPPNRFSRRDGDPIQIAEGILRVGESLWALVKANEPVLKTNLPTVSGLPKTLRSEEESDKMAWNPIQGEVFGYAIKNSYGMRVVRFVYEVTYQANGRHPSKKGLYLQNVAIRPIVISVLWGYRFDVSVKANVSNVGSVENPFVQADLELHQIVDSPLKVTHYSDSFHIRADGKMRVAR